MRRERVAHQISVTRRDARLPAVIAGVLLVLAAVASADSSVMVEGEDYVDYHDIGGGLIRPELCSSASGQYAADYIDVPGEWIMLRATFSSTGCYDPVVAYQANTADVIELRVTISKGSPTGTDISTDYSMLGYGIG
jgi:hypothetical protein